MAGFLPAWKGRRFNLDGCQVECEGRTVIWSKSEPGNQEATLSLVLRDHSFRLGLETTVHAAGPSEFSLEIVPDAVRISGQYGMVWVDGALQFLPLAWPFEVVRGTQELRFERADRTVCFRCSWMDLQDRRAAGGEMFLVRVISPSSGFPVQVSSFIERDVIPVAPRDQAGRELVLSQRPEELASVPVQNSGFEAQPPLEGWRGNPLASLVEDRPHGGMHCARLAIAKQQAQTADPYIIQQIPVEPRRLYQAGAWVRTEHLESAAIGDRHSTGSTVILEFADAQGSGTGVYRCRISAWFRPRGCSLKLLSSTGTRPNPSSRSSTHTCPPRTNP